MKSKLVLLLLILVFTLSACAAPPTVSSSGTSMRYLILTNTDHNIFCETFDPESRVGQNCEDRHYMPNLRLANYHLSQLDGWGELK